MKRTTLIFLLLIIASSVFFNFYNLERLAHFGGDQARDAQIMWQIIVERKLTLIGPGVAGSDSFFLGPLWYYLLLPFYFLFKLNPIGASVFGGLIGVVTTVVIFFLTKKMFGLKVSVITGIVWSTFASRVVWNPILIPLISIALLYISIKISEGRKKFIPWTLLLFGLSLQIHFQAVAYLVPLLLSIYFCFKKIKFVFLKELVIGIFLFVVTFIPLLVFDLRHRFINTIAFLKFFGLTNQTDNFIQLNIIGNLASSFLKFLNFISGQFPELSFNSPLYLGLIIFLVSAISIAYYKIPKPSKILILSFIISPFILFSLYRGVLSEYYFVLTWVPVIIGLVFFFIRISERSILGKCIVIFLIVSFFAFQFIDLLHENYSTSLYYQLQAVSYVVDQKTDPIFNVSYSTPPNEDSGYKYLFKYLGREPQNIPQGHLWTIVVPTESENVKPLITFGDIGVIRR